MEADRKAIPSEPCLGAIVISKWDLLTSWAPLLSSNLPDALTISAVILNALENNINRNIICLSVFSDSATEVLYSA